MPSPSGKLILIVDDNDDVRSFYQTALELDGHKTHIAGDTLEAKEWLVANKPDLMVLDIMMPDGNGLDFCEWVLKQERFKGMPILINSGSVGDEVMESAIDIGAADFMRKPVSVDALKAKVNRLLKRTP